MPLTNAQMVPDRFRKWAVARRKLAKITAALNAGEKIIVTTYTRATRYDKRHIDMFKATKNGLLIQNGRHWENADGCKFTLA